MRSTPLAQTIVYLAFICLCAASASCVQQGNSEMNSHILLDQEVKDKSDKAINSSTQSLNRYSSNLRKLDQVNLSFNQAKESIQLSLTNKDGDFLTIHNVHKNFIAPILPYNDIDGGKFDIANVILAEYARNGISIPIQKNNKLYASVSTSEGIFNKDGEYYFEDDQYSPNPGVLPKRISLVNNCLRPGLWEMNASDAVGEMYHSWFQVDQDFYYKLLSSTSGIDRNKIPSDFHDPVHFDNVPLELHKLRSVSKEIGTYKVMYNNEKELGAYSTQDSRRKVQRKFFNILRADSTLKIDFQEQMKDGDLYSMFSFIEPGVYDPNIRMNVEFNRMWSEAKISKTEPSTSYHKKQEFLESDYLEIEISSSDKKQALVIGNIPINLLSFKNDFIIPAYGAGVLLASEPIERRYLRIKNGPKPSFAYLAEIKPEGLNLMNNHLFGLEQVLIRPVVKDEQLLLRITLVSYERITDLQEFEISIQSLKKEFMASNENYSPPVYETYRDDNTL